MKKYLRPEIEMIEFDIDSIMTNSSVEPTPTLIPGGNGSFEDMGQGGWGN